MGTDTSFTSAAVLREAAERLSALSPTPRLDAEIIIAHVLQSDRLQLIMHPDRKVSAAECETIRALVERRANFEPVAYLTGTREFFGLRFTVTPDVLVPRPETELLVERAVRFLVEHRGTRFVDLGTGSGCIPIAVLHALRSQGHSASAIAIDKSAPALAVARLNAGKLGVIEDIEFREGEWLAPIGDEERFDLLISNPPYISPDDTEVSAELRHEPYQALYAGENGLADIAAILSAVAERPHRPKGVLLEIGSRQGEELQALLSTGCYGECYRDAAIDLVKDLSGLNRVIAITFQ